MGTHSAAVPSIPSPRSPRKVTPVATRDALRDSIEGTLALAAEQGLLRGRRTLVLRGRMPEELVSAAKKRTGITSDSKLLETALANLAVADDYAEWLYSQRGTVDPDLDLEF